MSENFAVNGHSPLPNRPSASDMGHSNAVNFTGTLVNAVSVHWTQLNAVQYRDTANAGNTVQGQQ